MLDGEELAFLALINTFRVAAGDGPLSLQPQLGAAVRFHSQDMVRHRYLAHTVANGETSAENGERFGYRGWTYYGESIAAGFATAPMIFSAWQ